MPDNELTTKWELILQGYNLGMARGRGQQYLGGVHECNSVPFDYTRKHWTQLQATLHHNAVLWADPEFRARRSIQARAEQLTRWKDPVYRARLVAAHTRFTPEENKQRLKKRNHDRYIKKKLQKDI